MENIVSCRSTSRGTEQAVRKALKDIGFKCFKGNEKILIKPNVNELSRDNSGKNTSLGVVRAVLKELTKKSLDIVIAEGTSIIGNAMINFKQAGYFEIAKEFGIELIDLNKEKNKKVNIPQGRVLKHVYISKPVLEADRIVNIPVLKTHILTTITCSLKNMKGCLPPKEKLRCHTAGLNEAIADYNKVIRNDLVVIDATTAMEGNGPHAGKPKKLNLVFAGYRAATLDLAITRFADIPLDRVPHLKFALEDGLGKEPEIVGDAKPFNLELPKRIDWVPTRISRLMEGLKLKLFHPKLSKHRPEITDKCTKCMRCLKFCPRTAIINIEGRPVINRSKCVNCLVCAELCPHSAIKII